MTFLSWKPFRAGRTSTPWHIRGYTSWYCHLPRIIHSSPSMSPLAYLVYVVARCNHRHRSYTRVISTHHPTIIRLEDLLLYNRCWSCCRIIFFMLPCVGEIIEHTREAEGYHTSRIFNIFFDTWLTYRRSTLEDLSLDQVSWSCYILSYPVDRLFLVAVDADDGCNRFLTSDPSIIGLLFLSPISVVSVDVQLKANFGTLDSFVNFFHQHKRNLYQCLYGFSYAIYIKLFPHNKQRCTTSSQSYLCNGGLMALIRHCQRKQGISM